MSVEHSCAKSQMGLVPQARIESVVEVGLDEEELIVEKLEVVKLAFVELETVELGEEKLDMVELGIV